ncbi:MAG TPA: hypothetical protein VFZ61_18830 [Polyangiales bacterium]
MRLAVWVRACALALWCAVAACSSGDDAAGTPQQVEVQIGRKGGRVELAEVTLKIPEGALDEDLKLSVREKAGTAPVASAKALSKVYEFGPPGTKFNKEIEVQFKVERDEPAAVVFFTKEERPDEFDKLPTERDQRGYVAKVKHFSAGFVGVDEATSEDAGETADAGPAEDGGTSATMEAGADDLDAQQPAQEAGAGTLDAGSSAPDATSGNDSDASDTAPDGGGGAPDATTSTPRIVLHTFDDVGTPANYTWAAFQDGIGPWQRLSPAATEGTYEFDVTGGRYGVAVVCADGQGVNSRGVVRYASSITVDVRIEIVVTSLCRVGTVPPMHTVYGPLTLPVGNYYYRYGHPNVSQLNSNMGATSLIASAFPGGKMADLVAGVGSAQDGGLTRVLIVRDLMLFADLQRPFDFVNEGSPVGPTFSVLLSNASESANLEVYYTTRREGGGMPMRQGPTSTPSVSARLLSYASIPAGLTRTDDRYLIIARENEANGGRELTLRTTGATNHNLALPAAFPASFNVETAPYLRPAINFSEYAGASQYKLSWGFFPGSETHSFDVLVDADYLPPAGTQTLVFPDFSTVPGFNSAWFPPADTTESVNMSATAHTYLQTPTIEQKTASTVGGTYRVVP